VTSDPELRAQLGTVLGNAGLGNTVPMLLTGPAALLGEREEAREGRPVAGASGCYPRGPAVPMTASVNRSPRTG
jgi:hypothetical protein